MDKGRIEELSSDVLHDSDYLLEIVEKTITSYTKDLDLIMSNIYRDVVMSDNCPGNIIEKYFLELSNCIYFINDRAERVGIYDGVSKAKAQEAYNTSYMEHQLSTNAASKKPTIAESTAYAETHSLHDSMVNEIYNKAYKTIKSKISSAETMVSTLSKVLSKRMSENQFSNVNNNTRQILNEEVTNTSYPF